MEVLQNILYIILTGCGVGVAAYVIKFLNNKVDEIQSATELNNYIKLNEYIDAAQDVIENAVHTVSQTYVDSLKASGKFTKEAQAEAKNQAIEITTALLTDEKKDAIVALYGDLNTYINSMIESYVHQNK